MGSFWENSECQLGEEWMVQWCTIDDCLRPVNKFYTYVHTCTYTNLGGLTVTQHINYKHLDCDKRVKKTWHEYTRRDLKECHRAHQGGKECRVVTKRLERMQVWRLPWLHHSLFKWVGSHHWLVEQIHTNHYSADSVNPHSVSNCHCHSHHHHSHLQRCPCSQ